MLRTFLRSSGKMAVLAILETILLSHPVRAIDWPQWWGPQRDGIWHETGLIEKFPAGGPKILWKIPIGTGYSGPAVAEGRVYVMDRERARDASGKPVRPTRAGIPGNERVLCLDVRDGKVIWKYEYDCPYKISYSTGPRTTPIIQAGRVFSLGAMGNLCCLDANSGKPIWTKNLEKDFKSPRPVWGWAANLLLDGDLLYSLVGGPGSAVVAFHKDTGKEIWRALTTEEVGYSPPMIYEAGGKRQLIIWLSESIHGLDPATGKVYWTQAYPTSVKPERPAVNIVTIRKMDDMLFLSTYYHGPMMLKLAADKPGASILWQGKSNNVEKPDGIHSLMAAPVYKEGYIYGGGSNGEFRCQEAHTGKLVWETFKPIMGKKVDCGTVFVIPQGDRYVLFNDQGDLIFAKLSPRGYEEIDRAHILEPVEEARGRNVVWSHPAFAQKCIFARNEKEMICVSMAENPNG